jgi:SAM-dependent methyltransferase
MDRKRKLKLIYNSAAMLSTVRGNTSAFMNLGYMHNDTDPAIELNADEEPYRLHIQLYSKLLEGIELTNKNVMEVGCGRGGGAAFIAKYQGPNSVLGTDLSSGNIRLCKKKFKAISNLDFDVADAENLPTPTALLDVIVNMESFMFYPNKLAFLTGVRSNLTPGGFLCLASPLRKAHCAALRSQAKDAGLILVNEEDLTVGVCNSVRKRYETEKTPKSQKRRNFEVSVNSDSFGRLESGESTYSRFIFQRQ